MPRELHTTREPNRAAIYARVSDKSQAEEDKTSLDEQTADMEDYCERRGLRIVARYQEVGRGWSKKRPEFQRMLDDAREGRFDVIVCWKSDRLSRGMFPAAALMEVVEAYQLRIESVMDAVDMKTFGLMAAIGKIELDNFRERAAMGKRGAAKRGRIATGKPPYGYRVDATGRPVVDEAEASVVRRVFHDYVERGLGIVRIAWDLTDEGVPTATGRGTWHESVVQNLLGNPVYTGTWSYGRTRNIATDEGTRVYAQPADTWIGVPVPPIVNEETFARAQATKRSRLSRAKRNTKVTYLLQHLLRCAECGRRFQAHSRWHANSTRQGQRVAHDLKAPLRYYACTGSKLRLRCREKPSIRAERLEGRVWEEVKRVLQEPGVIIAGMEAVGQGDSDSLAEEQAKAERDLRAVQREEERLVRLYVAGKISEEMLDLQRKFITERLEHLRARVDDYRARAATEVTREQLADSVRAWTARVAVGLETLTEEEKRDVLQDVVDEITVDGENNLVITVAIPIDGDEYIAPPVSRYPGSSVGQSGHHPCARCRHSRGGGNPESRCEAALTLGTTLVATPLTEEGMQAQQGPAIPPKLVIFDCDGVLVDSEPLVKRALLQVLASYGLHLSMEEAETHLKGLQNDDAGKVVAERWGVSLPDTFSDVLEAAEWNAVEQSLRPVAGAELAVQSVVDAGIPTCVASNGSPEAMEHRLKLTGLFHWFEGRLFSGWTVPRPKPYPDVFLHAADTMGYPPSKCVVIEDSGTGIRAGLAAGMRVLAYTGGSNSAAVGFAGVESFNSMSLLPELLSL